MGSPVRDTAPYFHDGSVASLPAAVRKMAYHQLGKQPSAVEVRDLVEFLMSLDGRLDPKLSAMPTLPPSGPKTPKPDPS